jgi:glycosyltransferase involved in cell wall biosynthesis
VAIIGLRGVPATFGGIEHHVEEVGSRLAASGFDVTVFCRRTYVQSPTVSYRGMTTTHLSTVNSKHFEAIVHSGVATWRALRSHFDIVHYHALGPGVFAPLPRYLSRAKVVQTIHGRDDERAKWSGAAQRFLRGAAWASARVPDATIVVSRDLADHYQRRYGKDVHYIPNGVDAPRRVGNADEIVARFGLEPGSYVLFVGRLVPEKAPDLLIRAFRRVSGAVRLVVAGGSSFTDEYTARLEQLADADQRVLMPGYVYGDDLVSLYANARAFVLPSVVEGLPLTLLEAASHGVPVVASGIPPHLEIVGRDGPGHRVFPPGDENALVRALEQVLGADQEAERAGAAALRTSVLHSYSWDDAAAATARVYDALLADD